MNTVQISATGLREVESSEGWSSGPYLDRVASPHVWTAYFGETQGIGPHSPRISRAEGSARLRRRFAADYAHALTPFVGLAGFNQNMYDALASFVWNCGAGAVGTSTKIGRLLRQRDWHAAADALMAWTKNGAGQTIHGLVLRRQRERALFLKPAAPDRWAGYTDRERSWITEYDRLLKAGTHKRRRVVLRYRMRRQARAIDAASKRDGWTRARRARVRSLEARSGGLRGDNR